MSGDLIRMCELLVGLGDVNVESVETAGEVLRVTVSTRTPPPACEDCGRGAG